MIIARCIMIASDLITDIINPNLAGDINKDFQAQTDYLRKYYVAISSLNLDMLKPVLIRDIHLVNNRRDKV